MPNPLVTPPPPPGEAGRWILAGMWTMKHACRLAGLLCCLGCGVLLRATAVRAQEAAPERVTSDTPEYCLRLFDHVSALVRIAPDPPPEEVTNLSTEGQRMCVHGQTRGGILRLRRALVLMREHEHDQ